MNEAKNLERNFADRVERGFAFPQDLEFVRDQRLELEILLVKTKRAAKQAAVPLPREGK